MLAFTLVSAALVALGQAQTPISTVVPGALRLLNATVQGRLHAALPYSAPCYSTVNGVNVGRDDAACAAVEAGYTNPLSRVAQFGAYMLPNWETCQATSEQCVLDNTNPSNPLPYQMQNCSQGNVPSYYIDIRTPSDVVAALAFSKLTGVSLVVKNSGHDYKGRSSRKGALGLWTHNLQGTSYSPNFVPAGCPASRQYHAMTVGAGVGWQTVYDWADTLNITAIGGYHQTVGASGGWLTGGGHSVLSPVYGLGVDRVVQFKVVTPDGVYRTANECLNSDLFWALRGGGGNAFGVIMESSSVVEPKQIPLSVASIKFTANGTASMQGWLRIVVDSALQWGQEGWGGHIGASNLINVTPLLNLTQAQASLSQAAAYARAYGGTVVIENLPSWNAFFSKYVPNAQSAVGPQNILGSRLMPTALFESANGRTELYNALVNMLPHANPYIVVGTPYLYKGAVASGKTSVSPAWYSSLWHLSMHEGWAWNASYADKVGNYTDVSRAVVDSLRSIAPDSGAYFNEGDVYEKNPTQTYWGANYARLLSIKNKYDPARLMDCWQCVGWEGPANAKFGCYPKILAPQ